jgi:hypothetical protein
MIFLWIVTWDPLSGAYIEDNTKKTKIGSGQRFYLDGESYKEEPVIATHSLCQSCNESYLKGVLLRCDFCYCFWHMDCLDPPLVIPPVPTQKWMCPNHPDHFLVSENLIMYILMVAFLMVEYLSP